MSNPYSNLSNISALPPSFFQNNSNMPALNLANLQQLGQAYGNQGQYTQQTVQPQFNMAALANIPPSALDGIQLPNQMNPMFKQQQQFQQQQQQLQQLQQQQQQNNQNAIQPSNFNPVLQTFQRLQAQERQENKDQRLPQNGQQQFIQQMQNMARQQQGGQQMRNMNGVNMPAVIAGMQAQGINIHSQQQGLQLNEEDTETGRRIALQNMLHQQYSQNVSQQQQQTNQPFQQSAPQFQQPQQQRPPSIMPEDFARLVQQVPPGQRDGLLATFSSGNKALAMHELFQIHAQKAGAQVPMQQGQQGQMQQTQMQQTQMQQPIQQATQQPVQPVQQPLQQPMQQQMQQQQQFQQPMQQQFQQPMQQMQMQSMQQMQQPIQQLQQPQMQQMQQAGTTPNMQTARVQQAQGRGYSHQRSESQQMAQMPGQGQMQGNQGHMQGQTNIDPKQFEALQQMRERQQRQAAGTPLKDANALPMVSPNYRQTPQNIPSQLPEAKPSVAESARGWTDEQLKINMAGLLKKHVGPEDPTRFHLLILISEFKRRELEVSQEAQMALSNLLKNPAAAQQILAASWESIQTYAQKSANTARAPRQVSSQGNPIEAPNPPGLVDGRRWAGMDFRDEPLPISENQIWDTLKKLHRKQDLVMPNMDGRPVDIYTLLTLVHRNGGSSRVDQNPAFWQYIGGHLGFGGGEENRSSPQVANELRRIWGQYLGPFEEAWYGKVLASRSQRSQPQPIPQQMIDLAAKNQGSEQHRQMMETARRLSNAQMTPNPGTPLVSAQPQFNPAMTYAVQSLRGNPGLCQNWIKSKEEGMRTKFPNTISQYADVPEHQRSAVLGELRSLAEAAKDAQAKMPKYLLVAAEKGVEEFSKISTLIQLYMIIILSCQQAEQGRFCYPPENIERLKYQLASLIINANTLYEEYRTGPEGIARADRLLQGLPKTSPRESAAALAANMPKGLRVEDLKPPPSKRAKGKNANSPATGATPEAAKTPASHIAESPVATSSPAARKPSAKRKRTGIKEESEMPPPPAPPPVEPSEAELELAQTKAFFKARSDLEQGEADIWAALAKVVEEYNAATEPNPDFFPKWIDASQLNESTPELYVPHQDEADTSPESIKTVPSTQVPPVFSETVETWEKRLIDMSPSSAAYNGGLFWDEYDYDFGVTV